MSNIPEGTTHRKFGNTEAEVQYYKFEDDRWYFCHTEGHWMSSANEGDWFHRNLIPVNLPIDSPLKQKILNKVRDLADNFMYYDRSADLPAGAIEKAIEDGIITVDEIVNEFRKNLI
jgi:hypothetical protein